MADVITQKTSVTATIQSVVAAEVQQVLTAESVMIPLVTDYSSMVGPGMDTLKIPKMGNFTVATKVAATPVDAQTNAITSDDLALDKHKVVQFLLEDIASLQSKVAITKEYIGQAAKDMAADIDQVILDALEAGVSTAAPDHKIAYANSPTNTIQKADVLEARKLLNTAKVPVADRSMVIAPDQEAALLAIGEFVKVNESGSEEALRNGLVGKLFGFQCYVHPSAESLKSMFFHKSGAAFARQLAPKTEMLRDLANLADRHSISHLYGVKVLDAGKRSVLVGTAA